ncbi:MAG: transcriptional repressor LexA [Magnetococcales bacterium]|nr:transcriptional repressor LexA [Magnetococcales bacterium]
MEGIVTENQQTRRRGGAKPMEGATPAQERMLNAIREFIDAHSFSPTVQELGAILGMRAPSVHEQIAALIEKGLVRRIPRKARSLEIVQDTLRIMELISVPIIGTVTAGLPILAIENRIGEVLVEPHVARGNCFALVVKGDSMIDARINDGDLVIVRRQPIAENGDIVVAMIDDEATVKRLYVSENHIELRPANTAYQPIVVGPEDELRILGKVLAVRGKTTPTA